MLTRAICIDNEGKQRMDGDGRSSDSGQGHNRSKIVKTMNRSIPMKKQEIRVNTVRILKVVCMAAMLVAGSAALAAEPAQGKNAPAPGIAAEVRALTGAETRIVWLRHKQWETYKGGVDGGVGFSIMAFDTGGKGERELVPAGEIYNPLISPDGRRVIYSTGKNWKQNLMHCVDWNGANHRILGAASRKRVEIGW
jgi:hypothetical protein